jgi:hypothetical protein
MVRVEIAKYCSSQVELDLGAGVTDWRGNRKEGYITVIVAAL